jgi:cytochrome P450
MYRDLSVTETLSFAAVLGIATHYAFRSYEPRDPLTALKSLTLVPILGLLISRNPLQWSLALFCQFLIVYVTVMTVSIFAYRLSPFHPLAAYPGPVLYKISKIPGMWDSWTGRQHHVMRAMHDKYGSCVRTGPNEVSLIEQEAVPAVFGASGLPKGQYYLARKDPNAPGNLIVLSGEQHANRRRLWNRGMGSESLQDYDLIIQKRGEQLVERLEGLCGSVIDMSAWFAYYTFDFMGDMCFGGGYEMLRDSADVNDRWGVLERFITVAGIISQVPWASQTIQKIPLLKKDLVKMRSYAIQVASKRYESGSRSRDLWYHLSDEPSLEKTKPAFRDVIADGALAIVAGTDTTSSSMTTLLFFLCRYRECFEKVRREIDLVFPEGADTMDTRKHPELVYLTACMNESLRLCPPVPTGGPRQVPDNEGRIICGRYFPPRTQIYIPAYSLQHSARYFEKPEEFIPERWIAYHDSDRDPLLQTSALTPSQSYSPQPTGNQPHTPSYSTSYTPYEPTLPPQGYVIKDPLAYIPFSYGPANCVGKNLAKREILTIIATLMQRFDFEFAAEGEGWMDQWLHDLPDHFITTKIPLWMRLKIREGRS